MAVPLAIDIIPSEAINGGILNRVTPNPVIKPANTLDPKPKMIAKGMLTCAFNNRVVITPVKAKTEPTDKSIPPTIRTKVIPKAIIKS